MMYNYFPQIPKIPESIINITEEEIRKIPDRFKSERENPIYTLHDATEELRDFLQPYFSNDMDIAFQLITDELPIHKDFGRTSCYNYLIKSGRKASTIWYDDDLKEIDRVIFPTHVWHNINVETFHKVVDVTDTRISISVWSKDENAMGEMREDP